MQRVEFPLQVTHRFGRTEEQHALGLQSKMQRAEHLLLKLRLHVDQEVAARHEVHARERRIASQVVRSEDHHLAELPYDVVAAALFLEKSGPALRADVFDDAFRKNTRGGLLQRDVVDVGGKDLHVQRLACRFHRLLNEHRQRIRFLAGRAGRDPDSQLVGFLRLGDQPRHNLPLQKGPGLGVAKEAGDVDQQVFVQRRPFLFRCFQQFDVLFGRSATGDHAPPLDPPAQRARLVVREIDPLVTRDERRDFSQDGFRRRFGNGLDHAARRVGCVVVNRAGQLARRQHVIGEPGGDHAAGHAVELGRFRVLHQHDPARFVDRPHAARPVAAGPRQDHADRQIAQTAGQRVQKDVDGKINRMPLRQVLIGQEELAVRDGHVLFGRNQIDRVRLQRHAVLDPVQRHVGVPREQLAHQTLEFRREMLHDDKRQPAVLRHAAEELLQRLQPPGRRADPDDVRRPALTPQVAPHPLVNLSVFQPSASLRMRFIVDFAKTL